MCINRKRRRRRRRRRQERRIEMAGYVTSQLRIIRQTSAISIIDVDHTAATINAIIGDTLRYKHILSHYPTKTCFHMIKFDRLSECERTILSEVHANTTNIEHFQPSPSECVRSRRKRGNLFVVLNGVRVCV